MNTLSFKTKSANDATVTREWHIMNATNLTLGRMGAKIAAIREGKNSLGLLLIQTAEIISLLSTLRRSSSQVTNGMTKNISLHRYAGGQKKK